MIDTLNCQKIVLLSDLFPRQRSIRGLYKNTDNRSSDSICEKGSIHDDSINNERENEKYCIVMYL